MKHYQSEEKKGISEGQEWVEQDMAVKADTPLVDSATGKKLVVRLFDFAWSKAIKKGELKEIQNHRQVIFNSHATYIKNFLWKDGLSVREDHDPKIIFNKTGYRIAVLCEARFGLNILEKGNTLQDIFKK